MKRAATPTLFPMFRFLLRNGVRVRVPLAFRSDSHEEGLSRLTPRQSRYYILGYVMEEYGIGNHCQGTGHHPEIHP